MLMKRRVAYNKNAYNNKFSFIDFDLSQEYSLTQAK